MKCKNICYKIYYQYKIADKKFTADDYFLYILSLYSCHLHHIAKVRKYISHTLKGFIDCLLLTNQIDILKHRNYINKIDLYVNYTKKKELDIMTKIKGLEGIYDLRKLSLKQIITLLYNKNEKNINKKYVTKVYNKSWALYNSLTDVIKYIEAIY